jgi:ATPase subunit of ABC transporter with duplicated ATPase domains
VGDGRSVRETVLAADIERTYLMAEEKRLEDALQAGKGEPGDSDEYSYIHSRLLEMEAWSAEARYILGCVGE